ncbi:MAG: hypothetical protein OES38_08200, partial [Gammaproteobacteria bacterium]|nr:hypothetical protein [Gammaproteobacteria bacterium]
LRASVQRSTMEWIVQYVYDQDRYVRESTEATTRLRYVLQDTKSDLMINPATADRNVVARPTDPVNIPPHGRATLYVSSPLWVRVTIPEGSLLLADLPVQIMSDSWFGPNTREGELCYSNETQARLSLDKLSKRPERLIAPVTVVNAGDDALRVDRVSLPLPLLSIYRGPESFWTQELVITREQAMATAKVEFESRAPAHLEGAPRVAEPRLNEDQSGITRALELLFG